MLGHLSAYLSPRSTKICLENCLHTQMRSEKYNLLVLGDESDSNDDGKETDVTGCEIVEDSHPVSTIKTPPVVTPRNAEVWRSRSKIFGSRDPSRPLTNYQVITLFASCL